MRSTEADRVLPRGTRSASCREQRAIIISATYRGSPHPPSPKEHNRMDVKTVKASDVAACPIRSLKATHYVRLDDGSIMCMCAVDNIVAGLPPARPRDESFAVLHRDAPDDELRVDAGDGIPHDAPRCAYRCTFCTDPAHGCTYEATTTREHDDGIDVDCCELHAQRGGGMLHNAALAEFHRQLNNRCICYRWEDVPNPLCRIHGHEDVVSGAYDASAEVRRRIDRQLVIIEEEGRH